MFVSYADSQTYIVDIFLTSNFGGIRKFIFFKDQKITLKMLLAIKRQDIFFPFS